MSTGNIKLVHHLLSYYRTNRSIKDFSTGMFEFKIGQTQSFTPHTKLAANHSLFPEALMTGQIREAKKALQLSTRIFARFAEFIYR
jgi:hypothetical protein